tara:strand:+ start:21738 stop:21902 length:165 start_codon:yes stop_codon:yes gene_type:complete
VGSMRPASRQCLMPITTVMQTWPTTREMTSQESVHHTDYLIINQIINKNENNTN